MLHGWHCECESCAFHGSANGGIPFPLRGQTDSTCSGEIISSLMQYGTPDEDAMFSFDGDAIVRDLCDSAVKVDAEPGLQSGYHVHVDMNDAGMERQQLALWAFLRWERLLVKLSAGRWEDQRGMNRSVEEMCNYEIRANAPQEARHNTTTRGVMRWYEENQPDQMHYVRESMYHVHRGNDRHSNLSIRTRHGTWEFRLWNSTRSAWRMELWNKLSVAMTDPAVVNALNAEPFPQRIRTETFGRFANLLSDSGYGRVAELVERQAAYRRDKASKAPSSLTIL